MAATVADALFNRLIDAFPAKRDYAASELARDPMPEPLRMHFEQRVSRHLDEATARESTWLDDDHPDVHRAKAAYRDALARHIRIPAAEWRSELALACRTVASYLIQPVPTLIDIVFEGGRDEATTAEVRARLDALPAYPYFSEVISAYLERKNLDRISRERFAGLARRIDHQMVRDFGAAEWMDLLEPLLDVTRQLPEFSGAVPADALRTFLKEKEAEALVARLDARYGRHHGSLIAPDELRELVEQPAEEEAVAEPAPYERREEAGAAERAHRADSSGRGSHVPLWKQFESGLHHPPEPSAPTRAREAGPSRTAAAGQPLWKQFRGGSPGGGAAPPEDESDRGVAATDTTPPDHSHTRAESSPHHRAAGRESAPNEWAPRGSSPSGATPPEPRGEYAPLSDSPAGPAYRARGDSSRDRDGDGGGRTEDVLPRERGAAGSSAGLPTGSSSAHARALEDLERSVLGQKGMRNRSLFLNHLFSGSERAYEDTLRKLDAADSWSEASQIIAREVFLKHQVNIYSDPAVAFTDAAEARFRR